MVKAKCSRLHISLYLTSEFHSFTNDLHAQVPHSRQQPMLWALPEERRLSSLSRLEPLALGQVKTSQITLLEGIHGWAFSYPFEIFLS